jgi:hypothetical protein
VDAGKGRQERGVAGDRALARAARDQEQRVRFRARGDRGDDRDRKPDARAVRRVRILGHLEAAAACLGRDEAVGVGDAAGRERNQRFRFEAPRAEQGPEDERGNDAGARMMTVGHAP